MAKPVPSPEQQELIDAEIEKKQSEIDRFNALIPAIDAGIADQTSIDEAFKDQFNWYNDQVIGIYNAERRSINGVFEVDPVTNADVESVVFDPTNSRLFPDIGEVDVKRIDQFDGLVTGQDTDGYELTLFPIQAEKEDQLVNGFGGTIPGGTLTDAVTTTALTPTSTQVTIDDTVSADIAFAIGDRFILTDGTNQVAIEVTNFTETGMDTDIWDVDFVYLSAGTLPAGAEIDVDFVGFTDLERTNKTSIDYQDIMDGLIVELENVINLRIAKYDEQIAIRATNEDPDGDFDNTNLNNRKDFLTNYLLTTDISDADLLTLSTDRTNREAEANARVVAINAAYTGQPTENFYDSRYGRANDRAQIRRGTLTEINRLELSKSSYNQGTTDRQQAIDALQSI